MTIYTVTTQDDLDAVLTEHGDDPHAKILIDSPAGACLYLCDLATVRACDSATVTACGSATVTACGSATVTACDSATVRAYDSATVTAYGSATVRAYDSATVRACDSATVRACDSATVRACGSATVTAYGSATVRAYDSATVRACDSATVTAYDSATVTACDSATVRASRYVAVHLHSQRVTLSGGVVIDTSTLRAARTSDWLDYTGASVDEDGTVHLYKAVDDDLCAGHEYVKTRYPIGEVVEPDQWRDDHYCGHGLHACPTPAHALDHYPAATRLIEVTCHRDDLRPIDWTKAKAPMLHVLREVDIQGAPIKPATEGCDS